MNNKKFMIKTKEFTTLAECRRQTKIVKEKIFQELHLDRQDTVLSHGLIKLYGLFINDETGQKSWFYLSNKITEFPEEIRDNIYHSYYLKTDLISKIN